MGLPARKIIPGSERLLEEISLSLDGKRILFVYESGEGYAVPREKLPGDDGSPIVSLQIAGHRHAVTVSQASGAHYDLPWDSIKYYASGGRQRQLFLGRQLRHLRKRFHVTLAALARATGLSRMQLNRLEKGKSSPSLDSLMRLAKALHVSPRALLAS